MKTYISGAITGLSEWQYKAKFALAAEIIRERGLTPVNPVEICAHIDNGTWEQYMAVCMAELLTCDAIMMLPCWKNSKGARIERAIAMELKLIEL